MTEIDRIRRQLQQAVSGPAWHGSALDEILGGIDARAAVARPVVGTHSIWEILLHLLATNRIIIDRIETGMDDGVEWLPEPEPTEANWQQTLAEFRDSFDRLQSSLSRFPDDKLDSLLKADGTTAYNNFHGAIQHILYHAAQINWIKKMLATSSSRGDDF
jgi:uncharacterized damage-inducible protein DinB